MKSDIYSPTASTVLNSSSISDASDDDLANVNLNDLRLKPEEDLDEGNRVALDIDSKSQSLRVGDLEEQGRDRRVEVVQVKKKNVVRIQLKLLIAHAIRVGMLLSGVRPARAMALKRSISDQVTRARAPPHETAALHSDAMPPSGFLPIVPSRHSLSLIDLKLPTTALYLTGDASSACLADSTHSSHTHRARHPQVAV